MERLLFIKWEGDKAIFRRLKGMEHIKYLFDKNAKILTISDDDVKQMSNL
jgi:hypothetical protein